MPIGRSSPIASAGAAERRERGDAALLHGRRRERREADHVADGVDALDRRAVELVDLDLPARVGLDAERLEAEAGGRALAAGRVEHGLRRDALAALEHDQRAALVALDGLDRLAEAEDHAEVAQRQLQRAHDLGVAERQQLAPRVDDRDLGADGGEHRRVLDADHAGADDDERLRDLLEVEDAVGVEDRLLVELDGRRPHGAAARRDHDGAGVDHLPAAVGRP